jgi:hypothetical protein
MLAGAALNGPVGLSSWQLMGDKMPGRHAWGLRPENFPYAIRLAPQMRRRGRPVRSRLCRAAGPIRVDASHGSSGERRPNVPRVVGSRNGRIARFSTVQPSVRFCLIVFELCIALLPSAVRTRFAPAPAFEPQRRNKAHSTWRSGIFKTQHDRECCGCKSTRNACATVIVALLRFTNPSDASNVAGLIEP